MRYVWFLRTGCPAIFELSTLGQITEGVKIMNQMKPLLNRPPSIPKIIPKSFHVHILFQPEHGLRPAEQVHPTLSSRICNPPSWRGHFVHPFTSPPVCHVFNLPLENEHALCAYPLVYNIAGHPRFTCIIDTFWWLNILLNSLCWIYLSHKRWIRSPNHEQLLEV